MILWSVIFGKLGDTRYFCGMIDKEERAHLHEDFAAFMKKRKMRQTPERFAILDKALDRNAHFNIDELYRDVDAQLHVCRATVYNTVSLLCDCNILRKHHLDGAQAVYEYAGDRHLHLICLKCGASKTVRNPEVIGFVESRKFSGFTPKFCLATIYGVCSKCARKSLRAVASREMKHLYK